MLNNNSGCSCTVFNQQVLMILLIFMPIIALSQSSPTLQRHQMSVGAGLIFVGSGDMIGTMYRNEYQYLMKQRLSLTFSLNFGQAGTEIRGIGTKTYRRIKNITTADAVLLFSMINHKVVKIKTGLGASLKKQIDNDPRYVGFTDVSTSIYPKSIIVDYEYGQNMRSFAIGWTVPVSVVLNYNRWSYELRPALHSYTDGEINTSMILGVGYRF
jgi:hypothetical protein